MGVVAQPGRRVEALCLSALLCPLSALHCPRGSGLRWASCPGRVLPWASGTGGHPRSPGSGGGGGGLCAEQPERIARLLWRSRRLMLEAWPGEPVFSGGWQFPFLTPVPLALELHNFCVCVLLAECK